MPNPPLTSVVLFLPKPSALDLPTVEHAAQSAFGKAFKNQQRTVKAPDRPMYGVILPILTLGVILGDRPYFGNNTGKAADAMRDFAAKRAIQQHAAWMSVDLMGSPIPVPPEIVFDLIGRLLGQLIPPDTLGLMRRPDGRVVACDSRVPPLLREGKVKEAFDLPKLDPFVTAKADDAELAAATAEARRRLPEFIEAFARRQPGHGFAVKKNFFDGNQCEHMWVEVTTIKDNVFHGCISNEPQTIRNVKLGGPATVTFEELEDWIYTVGKQMFGGFQIAVLQKYGSGQK